MTTVFEDRMVANYGAVISNAPRLEPLQRSRDFECSAELFSRRHRDIVIICRVKRFVER